MTDNTVQLRYGLRAVYIPHNQLAAQQRAQARKNTKRDDDPQLELDEAQP